MTTPVHTTGIIAAAITAFRENGEVDPESVPHLAQFLHNSDVAGVFVNGTTGEGVCLTVEEREILALRWRDTLPMGMRMFVHVGHPSLNSAKRLASHAQAIGADAVAAIAPGFFRPEGLEGLVRWCEEIAAVAPELPFYYYHMPSMNGITVRAADFLHAASERIPNLAGIKFTHEAMDDFLLCQMQSGGRYDILWGRDEMLLGALATGASGAVGSTYNIIAPVYHQLIEAFAGNDFAQARMLQARACRIIKAMAGTGHFFSVLKYFLSKHGLPITGRVRQPLPSDAGMDCAALDSLWKHSIIGAS